MPKRFAKVKLDDASTLSNGGVIVDIVGPREGGTIPVAESDERYIDITDRPEVKIGWILQDKTGLLIDSNVSNN